eukprot:CAMPEP_0113910052 /NCGR_PEP_ID=MMETSP0780_2-20120614/27266_1 /TAXON_ID=652834 /ORGANISM="Palpitomonas bilix" /LENGTH=167 /DNA_ID=CAMNT_0000906075 /DNA_START=57 /DNA_END=560 /DNA_ORIENTATION=- /assembly_acc=CAM_ASM_000599
MAEKGKKVEVDITYDDGGSLSIAVYSIDDAKLLRSRRIVGEHVGGGAASVQSRNAFSLPLLLSLPEAYTAIIQGIATCSAGSDINDREALAQIRKRDRRGACEAFEKLWLKGVWLTSGKRYGADFAVYAGDPLVYHAEALVKLDGIDGEGVLERVAQHAGKSLLDIE